MATRFRKYFRTLLAGSLVFGGVIVASVVGGSLPASASPMVALYVTPSGSGNCTSAATPCGSIQTAITTAEDGTYNGDDVTINVAASSTAYTGDDTVSASSLNSLTIAGAGASTTTVNGRGVNSVFTVENGTVTLSGLTVTYGAATVGGGIDNGGTLTITSSTVSGNYAYYGGGGIYNGGTLTINSSTVSGNRSYSNGGGIDNGGTLTINSSTVTGNTGYVNGGGIVNGGTLSINSSIVSGNTQGGGIYSSGGGIFNIGTLTISSSTVSGNSAIVGGGIYNGVTANGGTLTINSSTVTGNNALVGGGIDNGGTLTITSSTVSGNSSYDAGGGIYNYPGTLTIGASIVAGNTGSSEPNCSRLGGSFTSLGYNLTDDSTGADCDFTEPTDKVGVNPDLGALAFNGGPTETLLPAVSSPAIGVIPPNTTLGGVQVCPRTDQRGVASFGNCTIGAVEVPFSIATTSLPNAMPSSPYGPVTVQAANLGVSTSPNVTTLKWTGAEVPKGMKLSSTGVLSGKPSAKLVPGAYSVVAQVTETVTTLNGRKKVKAKTTVEATIPLTIT